MERMRNKDLENAWAVQWIRQEKCAKLEEENKKLKEENKKLREELSVYDREYFDEDKKAKNIFKEDDTYVYDAKQVRDIC
jgi:regulator of replication initiation timing